MPSATPSRLTELQTTLRTLNAGAGLPPPRSFVKGVAHDVVDMPGGVYDAGDHGLETIACGEGSVWQALCWIVAT